MLTDDKNSPNGKFCALQFLGTLTRDVFEARTSTGSELLSYLTCLHTTSFIILNIVSLVKTISLKIWERPLAWHANLFTSGLSPWLKDAAYLSSLLEAAMYARPVYGQN